MYSYFTLYEIQNFENIFPKFVSMKAQHFPPNIDFFFALFLHRSTFFVISRLEIQKGPTEEYQS